MKKLCISLIGITLFFGGIQLAEARYSYKYFFQQAAENPTPVNCKRLVGWWNQEKCMDEYKEGRRKENEEKKAEIRRANRESSNSVSTEKKETEEKVFSPREEKAKCYKIRSANKRTDCLQDFYDEWRKYIRQLERN